MILPYNCEDPLELYYTKFSYTGIKVFDSPAMNDKINLKPTIGDEGNMKNKLIERLISYAKVDTQSNENSQTTPSTPGQLTLANMLVEELKEIGMKDVTIDENGYVMATLPSNTEKEVPTIGFLAHVDTATDFTGKNVNPQVIEQYDGKDIVLNESLNVVLSPKEFPELADYAGHTLITTDGTTLLGADNKAGISEIMTAIEYFNCAPRNQTREDQSRFYA